MKNLFSIIAITIVMVVVSCNTAPKKETKQASCCSSETKSCCSEGSSKKQISFNAQINSYIDSVKLAFESIDTLRKAELKALAAKIKTNEGLENNLIFICTHNSRRSHMSQLWAQAAATYYGFNNVSCYSGGTEATAFNPRAVKALQSAGFSIEQSDSTSNPVYLVSFAEGAEPIKAFSKKYDDTFNPSEEFIAVMTCSDADEACPIVMGAADRVAIPYEDPKVADNTPEESAKYNERCYQIASEMFYVFSQVKKG